MRALSVWVGVAAALLPACEEPLPLGERPAVLVTGITGMLGSHTAEVLLSRGYEVIGFMRPRAHSRAIANILPRITVATGEMTDPFSVLKVLKKHRPALVFHYAAQAFNGQSYDAPDYTMDVNTKMTLNLLEGLRLANLTGSTKLFVASSSTVYGQQAELVDGPLTEDVPFAPVSPYGVSKAATELLALQYWRAHGLQVVVGRFFIHLAPRGTSALALHDFARQISLIEAGQQEPVLRHGNIGTRRDITDIRDSAPAVVCFAETAAAGEVVNVGSGRTFTMQQVLEMSLRHARVEIRTELDPSRARPYDEKAVLSNPAKLQRLTGFEVATPLEETARSIVDYWRGEVAATAASNPTGSPREAIPEGCAEL